MNVYVSDHPVMDVASEFYNPAVLKDHILFGNIGIQRDIELIAFRKRVHMVFKRIVVSESDRGTFWYH